MRKLVSTAAELAGRLACITPRCHCSPGIGTLEGDCQQFHEVAPTRRLHHQPGPGILPSLKVLPGICSSRPCMRVRLECKPQHASKMPKLEESSHQRGAACSWVATFPGAFGCAPTSAQVAVLIRPSLAVLRRCRHWRARGLTPDSRWIYPQTYPRTRCFAERRQCIYQRSAKLQRSRLCRRHTHWETAKPCRAGVSVSRQSTYIHSNIGCVTHNPYRVFGDECRFKPTSGMLFAVATLKINAVSSNSNPSRHIKHNAPGHEATPGHAALSTSALSSSHRQGVSEGSLATFADSRWRHGGLLLLWASLSPVPFRHDLAPAGTLRQARSMLDRVPTRMGHHASAGQQAYEVRAVRHENGLRAQQKRSSLQNPNMHR
jgi:hypothetical protein